MKIIPTELEGVVVLEPKVHRDPRGFFVETFSASRYAEAGIREVFVQDNHSCSEKDVVRGLHGQLRRPQAKLVRVIRGEIFDVVVDIRRGSPTFGRWTSAHLSAENFRQIYVPTGFAHGLCVLSESAEVEYKCSDLYDPADELRVLWNDPVIGIDWPTATPKLSAKDLEATPLAAWWDRLPLYGEPAERGA